MIYSELISPRKKRNHFIKNETVSTNPAGSSSKNLKITSVIILLKINHSDFFAQALKMHFFWVQAFQNHLLLVPSKEPH